VTTLATLHAEARGRGIPKYRRYTKAELESLLAGAEPVPVAAVRPPAAEAAPPARAGGAVVFLERDGPLATIVLDDPSTRNALGTAAMAALEAILDEIVADERVRLVALTGAGKVFCSGADIREHDALSDGGALLTDRGSAVLDRLAALPVPTVALVNGHAVGGGTEVALACDWRFMAPEAELRFVHASIGLVPGFGGLGRLAAIVGRGQALRLLAACESLDGRKAQTLGLADELLPDRDQRGRARSLAARIAGSDRHAIAAAKVALATGGREAEREAFLACWPNRRLPNARG
jgi:enoyl-CoA hydratase